MKVVSYLSGVPSPEKSPHKTEVLKRFINGVNKVGDTGIAHIGRGLLDADVGVIQGWVHAGSPKSGHLLLRKQVAENIKNKHTIIVDSNLFNYKMGKLHHLHYSRYSMDGVFPTTGNYFNQTIDPNRWKQISKDLNLDLKDWRSNGNHILICLQRNGGWSMAGLDVMMWLDQTITKLKQHTARPIVVRAHPGDNKAKQYLKVKHAGVTISTKPNLTDDLINAWATITYNSSPGVASAIEGVPVFVTDPNPKISQAYDIANTDLSQIESPKMFERLPWLEKLSMCHWKFDELSDGSAWTHFKNYV
jgi:hypothetical protein